MIVEMRRIRSKMVVYLENTSSGRKKTRSIRFIIALIQVEDQ